MKIFVNQKEFISQEIETISNQISIEAIETNHWHVLYHNKSFSVKLIQKNEEEQTIEWRINGKSVISKYLSDLDILLQSMGLGQSTQKEIKEIKSPMPGLVKKIMVSVGDVVEKGSPLLSLEAMKMENILKSPVDAKIAAIKINSGDAVEKNQTLIVFE